MKVPVEREARLDRRLSRKIGFAACFARVEGPVVKRHLALLNARAFVLKKADHSAIHLRPTVVAGKPA